MEDEEWEREEEAEEREEVEEKDEEWEEEKEAEQERDTDSVGGVKPLLLAGEADDKSTLDLRRAACVGVARAR